MRKNRKTFVFNLLLIVALLLPVLFLPRPVLAAQIDVKTTDQLYFAIEGAKAGDIVNVVADIDFGNYVLEVKNPNPFTITSKNKSKIRATGSRFLTLSPKAKVSLAGNLQVEAEVKKEAIFVDQAELILKDQVLIHAVNAENGISLYKSGLDISGASLEVTGQTPDQARRGVKASVDSHVLIRQGGQVLLENKAKPNETTKGYVGVSLDGGSTLKLTQGIIHVKSEQMATGLDVRQDCSALVNGNEAIIKAETGDIFPEGVSVYQGEFRMGAGQIYAESDANSYSCEAIRVSFGGQVYIEPAKEDDIIVIFSPSTGIFLYGENNLLDCRLSGNHWFSPGLEEGRLVLDELPRKAALTAGRPLRIHLHGVHPDVTFKVDPETSNKITCKGGDSKDQFILTSQKKGQYWLVLTTKTSRSEDEFHKNNTFTLRIPVSVVDNPFKDVKLGDWPLDYIMYLFREGVIKGYGNTGEFRPNNPIRRDHVAKMVAIGAGLNYKGKKANFPDVDPDGEMSPYIAALVDTGAIKGYPDGTFRPDQYIERGHAAKIVAKAFKLNMGTLPSNFPDLPPGQDGEAVKILASNGIVKGYKDGTFGPKKYISRAEFSKILTIAMAVSRIQLAEKNLGSWFPGLSKMFVIGAQELVDILPYDQDLATRNYLQQRLDQIRATK